MASIPLSYFGSLNWSNIGSIRIEMSYGYKWDQESFTNTLSQISVTLPEPGAVTWLGLGSGAVLMRRRFRRIPSHA